jgi:thiol:disulfide interchange protein DsbD
MKSIVRLALLVALLLAAVPTLPAAVDDDPFSEANKAPAAKPKEDKPVKLQDDPFSDANKAGAAKPKDDKPTKVQTINDRITFTAAIEPKEARPGETVRLTITGTPKRGYHTYPLTQRSEDDAQDKSGLCRLEYAKTAGLKPLVPVTESDPEWVVEKAGGVFLEHKKQFTWSQDILILPDAKPGDKTLPITINLQACDEKNCLRGDVHLEASIHVLEGPAVALTAELQKRMESQSEEPKPVTIPPELRSKRSTSTGREIKEASFFQLLALSCGAAFLMLLTPCVFPMIPITVSFFLKQAENKHNNPVLMAGVYCLTIVAILSAAVLLLGGLVIALANNAWLNLGMGLLLMFFSLSLFGMYEIELPHFLTRFTSAREGRGGYVGVFFMALTFTLTSFTCTGPFLGPLLVGTKEMQLTHDRLAVAAVTYSATFAAPFFFLALFPSLLKALPKSGGWLNAIKVVMGFVEVGLALKFFSIVDADLFPGNPRLFTYDGVLCTWIVLALVCGLYLLGLFRLPHDTPLEHIGVPRMLFATLFLGLGVYMTPALWDKQPQGAVGEFVVSFLPLTRSEWERDYEKAWQQAKNEDKLLFIDFTGVNCQNCRWNEKNVFSRPDVRKELGAFVLVQLYTDVVPDPNLKPDESHAQAERNMKWQSNTFGEASLPMYIVLDPSGALTPISEDGKLEGAVKGRASGTINNVKDFLQMLARAQGK